MIRFIRDLVMAVRFVFSRSTNVVIRKRIAEISEAERAIGMSYPCVRIPTIDPPCGALDQYGWSCCGRPVIGH